MLCWMKLPNGNGQNKQGQNKQGQEIHYISESMSHFASHSVPKRMKPPFHICLLYEGEYEDPYSHFVHCFDEEVLSRFPFFLHWLIVWWYNKKPRGAAIY